MVIGFEPPTSIMSVYLWPQCSVSARSRITSYGGVSTRSTPGHRYFLSGRDVLSSHARCIVVDTEAPRAGAGYIGSEKGAAMEAMSGLDDAGEGRGRLEETKRVARLVELATLLASQPGRWPRARLAERFEIGERQIARDLEILRNGLHYQIERTPGGYVIQGAPPLPPLVVTMPEALALALAAGLARDTGDVDAGTLGAVLAKLDALLPPDALGLLRRDLLRGATQ